MARVAEKAGLSRQAVYLHFPSREALLAALKSSQPTAPDLTTAPSARAALGLLIAAQAGSDPALASLAETPEAAAVRLERCKAVAIRFRGEGQLALQLSPDTAADLLWSLTGPRLWQELVTGRCWSSERYRSHITFLAAAALTH